VHEEVAERQQNANLGSHSNLEPNGQSSEDCSSDPEADDDAGDRDLLPQAPRDRARLRGSGLLGTHSCLRLANCRSLATEEVQAAQETTRYSREHAKRRSIVCARIVVSEKDSQDERDSEDGDPDQDERDDISLADFHGNPRVRTQDAM
jgi:hypothetical protein